MNTIKTMSLAVVTEEIVPSASLNVFDCDQRVEVKEWRCISSVNIFQQN